jgi:hypothetical protein
MATQTSGKDGKRASSYLTAKDPQHLERSNHRVNQKPLLYQGFWIAHEIWPEKGLPASNTVLIELTSLIIRRTFDL